MAEIHLPPTLPRTFAGLPRRLELDAASVGEAIDLLEARWPGLRDRICEPATAAGGQRTLRPHIRVFVDGERADVAAPLAARSRLDVIAAISGG